MILVEFTLEHPILLETLTNVPDIEVVWEETYERADGPPQMLVWIDCDDFAAVEEAFEADAAIRDPQLLTELGTRRLYRIDFTALGDETNLMPLLMGVGGVIQEAVGTTAGWRCQARFPDRSSLEDVYQFCADHDIPFTLHRLSDRDDWRFGDEDADYNLTEKQLEVLRLAFEGGYFEVPRGATLADIADDLGISKQAVSTRLRRGLANVLGGTVFQHE